MSFVFVLREKTKRGKRVQEGAEKRERWVRDDERERGEKASKRGRDEEQRERGSDREKT